MSTSSRFSTRLPSNADKGSVVLDIGKVYTRCGLSGEPAPRYIIRSNVVMKPYGQVQEVWDRKYINRDELYLIISRFLQNIYLKYLMVNSKEYRVVILESILCPSHFRNTLAKVLFLHLNVPYVAFVPSHLACTFTVGRPSALVVDVGYSETTVLPIYSGMPLVVAWQSTSYGGKALEDNLKKMLREHCKLRLFEGGVMEKPVEAARVDAVLDSSMGDILTRMCFVRPKGTEKDKVPPDAKYPISSDCTLLIKGRIRDRVTDILFDDVGDDQSLPICILEALLKSPIDCRSELSRNILVVGGVASLQGFNYRLQQELTSLCADETQKYHTSLSALEFNFHSPPSKANCTTWVGGSILGASEVAVLERAVPKEKFVKTKKLPDWTSCNPEEQEHFRSMPSRKLLPSVPPSLSHRQSAQTASS